MRRGRGRRPDQQERGESPIGRSRVRGKIGAAGACGILLACYRHLQACQKCFDDRGTFRVDKAGSFHAGLFLGRHGISHLLGQQKEGIMANFGNLRRAGALVVIGSALGALLISAPVQAQCVGDCNGDGEVSINELILGVNIALGTSPVSACEAFANQQGEVTIAQLIQGVNNALNGCPLPGNTPTVTNTPDLVDTPTPTVTETPGGTDIGTHTCDLIPGPDASHLSLFVAALGPVPLSVNLVGDVSLSCGSPDEGGKASCICEVGTIAPINLPNIGFVCIGKTDQPCPPSTIDCDGGLPLGLKLTSNSLTGTCDSNASCATTCDTYCNSIGAVTSTAACTGFCSMGTEQACSTDAECLPDNGACNGPDPVGQNDVCQCSCIDATDGGNSRPGDFQCNLGSVLNVESAAPCDGSDIKIAVGTTCVAQTTGTASTLITNANFVEGDTVPTSGALEISGEPISCENFRAGNLTGLKVRGVVNFFGSALGDIATGLSADCQ
ncbi:MAG: hypothetical protein ABI629_04345 [bacterium]